MDQWPAPGSFPGGWSPLSPGLPPIPPGAPTASDLRRGWYGIRLERGPVQSVTSIVYLDPSGTPITLSNSSYETDITGVVGRIVPLSGTQWPAIASKLNAIMVTYVTGYGAASAVPGDIVAAIKLILGDLYENRESQFVGNIQVLPNRAVDYLLAPYELPEAA